MIIGKPELLFNVFQGQTYHFTRKWTINESGVNRKALRLRSKKTQTTHKTRRTALSVVFHLCLRLTTSPIPRLREDVTIDGQRGHNGAEGWTETLWGPVDGNETDRSWQEAEPQGRPWLDEETGVRQIGDYKQPPFTNQTKSKQSGRPGASAGRRPSQCCRLTPEQLLFSRPSCCGTQKKKLI